MSVPKDSRREGELAINVAARKKLARLVRKCLNGEKPRSCADNSYKAWRTHAAKGNSYKLIRRMDDYYRSLWAEGVFK